MNDSLFKASMIIKDEISVLRSLERLLDSHRFRALFQVSEAKEEFLELLANHDVIKIHGWLRRESFRHIEFAPIDFLRGLCRLHRIHNYEYLQKDELVERIKDAERTNATTNP